MKTITIPRTGNAYLSPAVVDSDGLVEIKAGPAAASVGVIAQWGYRVNNQQSTTLTNGQTLILKYDGNGNFNYISGHFTVLPQVLPTPPTPATPVAGELKQLPFTLIANQADYVFDGTLTAWNPNQVSLIGASLPMFTTDGIGKVLGTNYTFSDTTGTISIIGKVYAGVLAAAYYQLLE